jgi:hypothetical protein
MSTSDVSKYIKLTDEQQTKLKLLAEKVIKAYEKFQFIYRETDYNSSYDEEDIKQERETLIDDTEDDDTYCELTDDFVQAKLLVYTTSKKILKYTYDMYSKYFYELAKEKYDMEETWSVSMLDIEIHETAELLFDIDKRLRPSKMLHFFL